MHTLPDLNLGFFNESVLIVVLFMMSGFFSGTEAALFALGKMRLKKLEDMGYRSARYITSLLSDPEKLMITIIFSNLFVNTLISSMTTIFAIQIAKYFGVSEPNCVTLGTFIMSYFLILIGEVTPINLALYYSEPFSRFASYPVYFLTYIFSRIIPIIPVFKFITRQFMPLFGLQESLNLITEQELHSAISLGEREGMLEHQEKQMIHSIFEFGDTIVKEIMTPRVDMVCVKADSTIESVIKTFKEAGYSRLPVYENKLDNIVGIVHAKDLLGQTKEGGDLSVSVRTLLRNAYFVPETKQIDSLLKDFQQKKVQMAIVVDEYGGTEGLITMEDIIEEIVGEILDEHDVDESLYEKLDIYTYKVDPKIPVSEFNSLMGVEIPEELFETLGGLLYDLIGHIPHIGEEVAFENLQFKIIHVDGKRIKKVFVKKIPEAIPSIIDLESDHSDKEE